MYVKITHNAAVLAMPTDGEHQHLHLRLTVGEINVSCFGLRTRRRLSFNSLSAMLSWLLCSSIAGRCTTHDTVLAQFVVIESEVSVNTPAWLLANRVPHGNIFVTAFSSLERDNVR